MSDAAELGLDAVQIAPRTRKNEFQVLIDTGMHIRYTVGHREGDSMARKTNFYRWSAKIKRETLPDLQELARDLGFVVEAPGGFVGNPSPPDLLDALAAAYERDPDTLTACLRSAGVARERG
jgi:hypothetical protein